MKLKITALSVTLVLASMLGACSSVNSSNPSVEDPSVNSGLELDSSAGIEGVEEAPTDSTEMEATDLETVEEPTAEMEATDLETVEEPTAELESTEIDNPSFGSSEEPTGELESAEIDNPELEGTEELTTDLESTDMENSLEQGTPEIESSEAPIESQGSEVILPVEDAAQTPTESEAAENPDLEPAQ